MNILMLGNGRLGTAITNALMTQGHRISYARLNATTGVDLPHGTTVDLMVCCLVPKHPQKGSGWIGLFEGVKHQVSQRALTIARVVHVSSTSVYECITSGFVNADTTVAQCSSRTQGLCYAEESARALAPCSVVFRLTGLVGEGYEKYDPIRYSYDKPRQAVDINAVANAISSYIANDWQGHPIEVLTDGKIYWQGKTLPQDHTVAATLAQSYRLLRPSIIAT